MPESFYLDSRIEVWRLDHKVAEILSPRIPEKVDFFQEYDSISLNFLKDLRKIRDPYYSSIA